MSLSYSSQTAYVFMVNQADRISGSAYIPYRMGKGLNGIVSGIAAEDHL
jgi:hypothetical protein